MRQTGFYFQQNLMRHLFCFLSIKLLIFWFWQMNKINEGSFFSQMTGIWNRRGRARETIYLFYLALGVTGHAHLPQLEVPVLQTYPFSVTQAWPIPCPLHSWMQWVWNGSHLGYRGWVTPGQPRMRLTMSSKHMLQIKRQTSIGEKCFIWIVG